MIPPPKRSVTRFFIPLIDVMTLLFCIFLLMPYVQSEGEAANSSDGKSVADPAVLAKDAEALRKERDRLIRERDRSVWRQAVCVLEFDGENGKLYYRGPGRPEIRNQADAFALIDRMQKEAGGREVYFLFLQPRDSVGYPSNRQWEAIDRWFKLVPHGLHDSNNPMPGGNP